MRFSLTFLPPVAAAILAFWWWLAAPIAMPPSPLAAGEKLPCVSYTPFARNPDFPARAVPISAADIDADLAVLSRLTSCIRTYAVEFGLEHVPEIARRHGLKVLQGIWLGAEPAKNQAEIAAGIDLVRRYPDVIQGVIVGNETLLRGEMAPETLAGHIRAVKAQVSVPVTYADVWEFWLRYRQLADAVDFVTVHMLPYWEDIPIAAAKAGPHVDDIRQKVAESFPGKEILIGEVGWPSAGRMREGALPSRADEARVIHDVLAAAKRRNYRVNVIEAFDQPWKRKLEGTVGGHWGVVGSDGQSLKFEWGQGVSNHPAWRWQAGGGIAFAALVFGVAYLASRRAYTKPSWLQGIGVAVIAAAGGGLIGWTAVNLAQESLGIGGWAVSLTLAGLAVICPLAGAAAVTLGVPRPRFASILGGAPCPKSRLATALGMLAIILMVMTVMVVLGLVFDPRYRDFPFAPLTAAAVPFVVLWVIGGHEFGRAAPAERIAGAVLAAAAAFITFNEGFANWQSLWLCAVVLAFAATLVAARDVPG